MREFPAKVYITLEKGEGDTETLRVAFDPGDCDGEGSIAVYELRATLERQFVESALVEQRGAASSEGVGP